MCLVVDVCLRVRVVRSTYFNKVAMTICKCLERTHLMNRGLLLSARH